MIAMAKRKTALERIEVLRARMQVLDKKIDAIQDECPHSNVKTTHTAVGFNGYSTDYTSWCECELCGMFWHHDGYCSGGDHRSIGKWRQT